MYVIFRYAAILWMMVETLPMLRGYFVIRDWAPNGAMVLLALVIYPRSFLSREMLFLVLYLFILLIFATIGHAYTDRRWIANEIQAPLTCLSIINVFLLNRDYKGLRMFIVASILVVVVSCLLTLWITFREPGVLREVLELALRTGNQGPLQKYQQRGLASFGLIHAIIYLHPLFVHFIKSPVSQLSRIVFVFLLALTYFTIVKSEFSAPLIITSLFIPYAFSLSASRNLNIAIGVLLVIVLALTLNEDVVIYGLESIKPLFEHTKHEVKIDNIIDSLKRDTAVGDVRRTELYALSWNSFLESPIYGNLEKGHAGGHAYVPDRLAFFGLVGTIPYLLVYYSAIKKHYTLMGRQSSSYYVLGVLVFVILAFFKNINGIENWLYLFVILPGLCILREIKEESRLGGLVTPLKAYRYRLNDVAQTQNNSITACRCISKR